MTLSDDIRFGIRPNLTQFLHQLVQVFLVGMTLGLMRTVVPALAQSEYAVPRDSFTLLTAFVVAFGVVKALLNFLAGHWSERVGRRRVLLWGWLIAVPVPLLVYYAPTWNWIVFATVLLGINQGLTWSMTQTAKLDLAQAEQRGLTIGLNEFAGYVGVAIAGVITGHLVPVLGARPALLLFGLVCIALALLATWFWVNDTLPWARAEADLQRVQPLLARARYPHTRSANPPAAEIFLLMSWRDRRMAAFCQAGLVEKFVDALVWVFYPVFLYERGMSLATIGWIVGVYGFVWGGSQLLTGRLSDHSGRRWPIITGMWVCGSGVALTLLGEGVAWWSFAAAVTGFGMALLYPNLSAAVSDIAHPDWRGTAIGIYRFWRDLGYALGGLLLGLVATGSGAMQAGFWWVAAAMWLSGFLVLIWGEETHPGIHPVRADPPA